MPLIISDSNNYTRRFNKLSLKNAITFVLRKLKLSSKTIYITFISDYKMKKINNEYRQKNSSTDVLSFNYENSSNNVMGEILISMNYCKKNILKNKNSLSKEVIILSIHGILHLLGYDHDSVENEKIMFELQEKLYSEYKSKFLKHHNH
ncbi:rRNA maturation RNase YbeY [bacterium]|nr:rRNA maturation RNase YbeY [bacterium]